MPITVYSPHNGEPVKIRDQDIGRAVQDREGRTFFAVLKSDGSDYYGSFTRHGTPKDEQRYAELEQKLGKLNNQVKEKHAEAKPTVTGKQKSKSGLLVKLVVALIILLALAWLFTYGPLSGFGEQAVEEATRQIENAQQQNDAPPQSP
jgi:hypothetical protein